MTVFEKFSAHDSGAETFFVNNGFVILSKSLPESEISLLWQSIHSAFTEIKKNNHQADSILSLSQALVKTSEIGRIIAKTLEDPRLTAALMPFLGPDISMLNHINLWVNDPEDRSVVTNKATHQEMWSGCSIDDLTVWVPLSKVDNNNTLSVIPGSHIYGLLPNRNRQLLDIEGFTPSPLVPLIGFEPGDIVVFHPLLLHATAGRSDQFRYSLSAVYKNSYAPTSAKYQSIGYKGLTFGAMTQVKHVLGNDFYSPLRTYGGCTSNAPSAITNMPTLEREVE